MFVLHMQLVKFAFYWQLVKVQLIAQQTKYVKKYIGCLSVNCFGRHLTRKSGVLGSIPSLVTYFRFSFRFFKKGSCQLLAKVCARSTG